MSTVLIVSSAAAILAGIGHSVIGEYKILRPLYKERSTSTVLAIAGIRRIIRLIWHLPSLVWILTGVVIYGFAHHGQTPPIWFVIYAGFIFGVSAIGNYWGVRKPHIGSFLLAVAAGGLALSVVSNS